MHRGGEDEKKTNPDWQCRSMLQIAELKEKGGVITVERGNPTIVKLTPPNEARR